MILTPAFVSRVVPRQAADAEQTGEARSLSEAGMGAVGSLSPRSRRHLSAGEGHSDEGSLNNSQLLQAGRENKWSGHTTPTNIRRSLSMAYSSLCTGREDICASTLKTLKATNIVLT